jgi:Ca-activated chloride channel homolog
MHHLSREWRQEGPRSPFLPAARWFVKSALSVVLDRRLAVWKGGSVRYLVATVETPFVTETAPLDLALVVDTSGSMDGAPLEAVRAGVTRVVAELRPDDRLSLVAFGAVATTLLQAVPMTDGGRRAAQAALAGLAAGGHTNLSAGWVQGAELVGPGEPGRLRHVVLLTDGHANEGETDPERLRELAARLQAAGVTTTAIGVGDAWTTAQIEPIALHGGGRLHHAAEASEVVRVLEGELQEARATVVVEASLALSAPSSVRATPVGVGPLLGALPGAATRHVVWRLECPAGPVGATLPLTVELSWREVRASAPAVVAAVRAELAFGGYGQSDGQPRDPAVRWLVAQTWQSAIVREVVRRQRLGDVAAACRHLDRELRRFARFVDGLERAHELLVAELRTLRAALDQGWLESQRKEVEVSHLKRSRGERDSRGDRPSWTSHLPGAR